MRAKISAYNINGKVEDVTIQDVSSFAAPGSSFNYWSFWSKDEDGEVVLRFIKDTAVSTVVIAGTEDDLIPVDVKHRSPFDPNRR